MLVWKKRHLREEMPFLRMFLFFLFFLFSLTFHLMLFLSYFYHFCRRFRIFLFTFVPVNHKRIIYVEITFKALVVAAAP